MTVPSDPVLDTARRDWIFQGARLRAFCDNPSAPNMRAKFNYLAKARHDFDALSPISPAKDPRFAQIFVQTSSNDYYLNDELPLLRAALFAYCGRYDRREAIGFSMGGFGAIMLARAMQLTKVLLVSPVSEMAFRRPQRAFDPQWEEILFCGEDTFAGVHQALQGTILCDPQARGGRDLFYARFLQRLHPNLHIFCLPWAGHPATKLFSETGSYGQLRQAFFDGTLTPHKAKYLQRTHRMTSLRYREGVQAYLIARAARI